MAQIRSGRNRAFDSGLLSPVARRAFTLLEIILVLGMIVVVMAIAAPSVSNFYKGEKLLAATDGVRGSLAEARVHAIDQGRAYRVSVVPGRGNYRFAPDDQEYWNGATPRDLPSREGVLPPDIGLRVVVDGQNLSLGADGEVAASLKEGEVPPDLWSTVAVFRPDGTADRTVEIIFSSPHCLPLSVTLRSLTGTTSVRRLSS
jgi:type II secretory pathway pseudopilin PulG